MEFFYCCLMQRLFVKNAIPYYFLVFFQFFYQILNSSNKANLLSLIYPPITFWSSSKWLTGWPTDRPIPLFIFISFLSLLFLQLFWLFVWDSFLQFVWSFSVLSILVHFTTCTILLLFLLLPYDDIFQVFAGLLLLIGEASPLSNQSQRQSGRIWVNRKGRNFGDRIFIHVVIHP